MKTATEHVSIFPSHAVLKRLLDEYDNIDTARRLCADYCITADEVSRLIDDIPRTKRSKSRLRFSVRSNSVLDIGDAYLVTR